MEFVCLQPVSTGVLLVKVIDLSGTRSVNLCVFFFVLLYAELRAVRSILNKKYSF